MRQQFNWIVKNDLQEQLRNIRAEVCLSFDVCLVVKMSILSGPFMNEGVSSDSMIKICCFCASVSDVWVKWSVVVGSRALDDSEGKIWMCWFVLGSHRTKFRVGTSDRLICCLVLHRLFLVTPPPTAWSWALEGGGGCLGMMGTARGMLQNTLARKLASWVNFAPIKS
jgi:hypothetical protein